MQSETLWLTLGYLALLLLQLLTMARAILRPNREPASRIAWLVVIAIVPLLGIILYLLFGETSIGQKRSIRRQAILEKLRAPLPATLQSSRAAAEASLPDIYKPLFRLGETINGFRPLAGNSAQLTRDSNHAMDCLVADIDAATEHVHICFYIWLTDNNGLRVIEALKRAAGRGVTCRAMADSLGSRRLIRSRHWRDMADAGVRLGVSLAIGNPLLRPLQGRIDLRNHRKVVVIDQRITYCGSQNCADPEFRVKAKYAPWVDIMARFEGPIVLQNQFVFATDWMSAVDEDLSALLSQPVTALEDGFSAMVIATGPTVRASAMPEVFSSLMFQARRRLVITTPYYVPSESMQAALCGAANRGVETTLILPARNDSMVVAGASRSYYQDLLQAGVKIHEFEGGLLHSKTVTADDAITLLGSANMDRRSFDLNFENNILLCDAAFTSSMRQRQLSYLASAREVRLEDVRQWSTARRLWNNSLSMLGPIL